VTGVDFSPVALEKARLQCADRGFEVSWVGAYVVEWTPPAAAFDLVLVLYLHLPASERRQALAHAKDVGHDSCNLLEGTGGPQDQAILYRSDDIAEDLARLKILRAGWVTRSVLADEDRCSRPDRTLLIAPVGRVHEYSPYRVDRGAVPSACSTR
jgi:hypothetical protein